MIEIAICFFLQNATVFETITGEICWKRQIFFWVAGDVQLLGAVGVRVRRDGVGKAKLPGREEILRRMWRLANAGAEGAVRLACFPEKEWGGLEGMDLDGLTEFKRGSNGVVELKFVDKARLLERLLEAADHSGEEQVDRFLRAMEEKGE